MSEASESREVDLSELYAIVLSLNAKSRARHNFQMKIMARILSRLENRSEEDLLKELRTLYDEELRDRSEELKDAMRR